MIGLGKKSVIRMVLSSRWQLSLKQSRKVKKKQRKTIRKEKRNPILVNHDIQAFRSYLWFGSDLIIFHGFRVLDFHSRFLHFSALISMDFSFVFPCTLPEIHTEDTHSFPGNDARFKGLFRSFQALSVGPCM